MIRRCLVKMFSAVLSTVPHTQTFDQSLATVIRPGVTVSVSRRSSVSISRFQLSITVKSCLTVCVCVLTMVAEIITAYAQRLVILRAQTYDDVMRTNELIRHLYCLLIKHIYCSVTAAAVGMYSQLLGVPEPSLRTQFGVFRSSSAHTQRGR